MTVLRLARAALVAVLASLAVGIGTAGAQTDPASVARPPVLVTGDSLSHQAADDIARSLGALGYHDVRFEVWGGTTISWSTDRVLEHPAPIVVFASGTFDAAWGWTPTHEEHARRAVEVLEQRGCAIWVLPAAARYPDGVRRPHPESRDGVAGIRRAVDGSGVHLAEWDLVADALPEIHVADGVHVSDDGQVLYGDLVAGSVRHRCEGPDPSRTAPQARYASWAIETLLGRDPTATAIAAWTDRLASGHPRLAFTRALTASTAWTGTQVDDLYRRALDRDADPAGRTYWGGLVAGGVALDAIAAHVFGSDELIQRSGGTPSGFVTALYHRLLRREPEPPGLDFWLRTLAGGASPPTVAASFHRSPESRGDRVDALYRLILGRSPDPAGRAAWVDALATVNDLRLAALLAASDEAYARAQTSG